MWKSALIWLGTVVLLVGSVTVFAEQEDAPAQPPAAPWEQRDVLIAAIKVGMNEEQLPIFRSAVGEFLQGFGSDVRRIMNSNNHVNLPRQIATKRRNRAKDMDEAMAELLTEEQYPLYEVYRDTLLAKMDEQADARRARR